MKKKSAKIITTAAAIAAAGTFYVCGSTDVSAAALDEGDIPSGTDAVEEGRHSPATRQEALEALDQASENVTVTENNVKEAENADTAAGEAAAKAEEDLGSAGEALADAEKKKEEADAAVNEAKTVADEAESSFREAEAAAEGITDETVAGKDQAAAAKACKGLFLYRV